MAGTFGYTNKVINKGLETDATAAYTKVIKDWNIKSHNGMGVDHDHGKWAIRSVAGTQNEYFFVSSHNVNVATLELNLNQIETGLELAT